MRRHPVVAEDRNARGTDVANRLDHVLDLLLPVRPAEHDVQVEVRRHVLQSHQLQAFALYLQPQLHEVVDSPLASSIGQLRRIEQHVLNAVLGGEPQILTARRVLNCPNPARIFVAAFRNYPVSSELQVIHQLYDLHCRQAIRTIMFVVQVRRAHLKFHQVIIGLMTTVGAIQTIHAGST